MRRINAKTSLIYRLAVILASIVLVSCGGKQISGFKAVNKSIDTLVVLPPVLALRMMNKEYGKKGKLFTDTIVLNTLSKKVSKNITSLLSTKYAIDSFNLAFSQYGIDTTLIEESSGLIINLKKQKRTLNATNVPESILKLASNTKARYFLGSLYYSNFQFYEPKKNNSGQFATSVAIGAAVAVATMGTVVVVPIYNSPNFTTRFAYYVFDKKENRILFFKSSGLNESDPRDPLITKSLVYKSIKPLYYK